MIVAHVRFGRLGNQLELASHLIAFAELTGQTVCLHYLGRHARHFPYFDGDFLCAYPYRKGIGMGIDQLACLGVLALARCGLVPSVDYLAGDRAVFFDELDMDSDPGLRALKNAAISVFSGWRFRARKPNPTARRKIQEVFTPRPAILQRGQALRQAIASEVVIGIHIRWGDYRTAYPDFYFGLETYRRRMQEARSLFPGKTVGFIVCCEEGRIAGLDDMNCLFAQGDAVQDMYALAQCDYIIGTASTFATWASYWGNKGLFLMRSADAPITSIGDFAPFDWGMPGWPPA